MELIDEDNLKKCKTIDNYLNKIGYAFYQKYLFVCVIFQNLADGSELAMISILIHCVGIEWNLTNFEKSVLGSTIAVGLLIGALLSTHIADRYGRKPTLLIPFLNKV